MKYYALLSQPVEGVRYVNEIIPELWEFEGVQYPLNQRYTQWLIDQLIECPADTQPWAVYNEQTGEFTNPSPPPEVDPVPQSLGDGDAGNGNPPKPPPG